MFKNKINYSQNKNKYDSYSREIVGLVPSGSRVLDVGCTTGKLAKALKSKKCRTVGIDIDESSLKVASKFCEEALKVDVDDLGNFDKQLKGMIFDAVALGDILEHLKHPGAFLFNLHKYLKPSSIVIASIPNAAFIWARIRFMLGNFTYTKNGGLMDEDHLHFFSFNTAKQLFSDAGYEVSTLKGSSHGIVNPKFAFIKLLARIAPTLFAIHIMVVAKPCPKQEKGKN